MSTFIEDTRREAANAVWLANNPAFEEKPATIREFIGERYLNIESLVRLGVTEALVGVFGEEVDPKRISQYERAIFSGAVGVGKQLDPDELVLTPSKEWVQIQKLKVGDLVIGSDGKSYSVTNTTRWEDIERYKITFKDGTQINCGADHLWTFSKRVYRSYVGRVIEPETMDTRTLFSRNLKYGDSYVYDLPIVKPVQYENDYKQEVHPYIMGLMIANGSFTHITPSIAFHDDDKDWIVSQVEELVPDLRAVCSERNRVYISGEYGRENYVQKEIRQIGLEGVTALDKFIPDEYMYASPDARLALLRGLMDGDGHQSKCNQQQYATSSELLSIHVALLVRSLGGYCTVTNHNRLDGSNTEYHVSINLDDVCPFLNPRKVLNWKPRKNQPIHRSVKSVEKIENGPGVCISVDSPDRLYVVRDFIVTHNTTYASIALPYALHWTLCLKNPQAFYGLMPGTRIAFMMMSTSAKQAREVLFGDIVGRIDASPWFNSKYATLSRTLSKYVFPKDLWIVPGDSRETTFEGYNLLMGIIDEIDSHMVTANKDYADVGYDAIESRIASRFLAEDISGHRGLIICIGQMKKATGFAARKYKEFLYDKKASVVKMTIWESMGWNKYEVDGIRQSFTYDIKRKTILPPAVARLITVDKDNFIEVPTAYLSAFMNNPEKALRDLAGIPPQTFDPFISLIDRIEVCSTKWTERFNIDSPVNDNCTAPQFEDWFRANGDTRRRAIHIDMAWSGEGDALGIAMGYVSEMVDIEGDLKPYIIIDMLYRVKARPGTEIILSDVRLIVYEMQRRGFKVQDVTMDGFNSKETQQSLLKRKLRTTYLSVDRSTLPYEDLRETIYDGRLEFPKYMTYLHAGATSRVEIALQELSQLRYVGKKVDHPEKGSKDIADCVAGVVTTLTGDRNYARGKSSIEHKEARTGASISPVTFLNTDARSRVSNVSQDMDALIPPHMRRRR